MRIRELLEHIEDKNKNGIDDQLEFDLSDDLLFFMNNDDDTYRRHLYPAMAKAKHGYRNGFKVDKNLFSSIVNDAYKNYCEKYPMRELPDVLPKEITERVCNSLHADCKQKDSKD